MTVRIVALIFIYLCTCIGWVILGGSVWQRTQESTGSLRENVASIWGRPQTQFPPVVCFRRLVEIPAIRKDGNEAEPRTESRVETVQIPLTRTRVNVEFHLEHRRKGLVWYSTYRVAFGGQYSFVNPTNEEREVTVEFQLPDGQAVYDGFTATVNGREVGSQVANSKVVVRERLGPGGTLEFNTAYRSQGLDTWTYAFAKNASRIDDFVLTMVTDFERIDFPESGLSPTSRTKSGDGWELRWDYASLLSGLNIAMAMPAKLQPGELVGRVTFFAPVSLMFFFFLLFILTVLKDIDIHPMNYFFLAAAFFSFHLLLAYTADHIDIHLAFLLSSVVSIFLVVSYLRLVVGMRFALREAGLLQFLYLVGFSYTFFLEGYSALCVTIASIITLFIVMRLTGRIRWAEFFQRPKQRVPMAPPPPPAGNSGFVPLG